MKTLIIQYDHEVKEKDLWRKDFIANFSGLNIRDLRPVFLPTQVSTILPREEALIVNLGFIKSVLTKDEAYFFIHRKEKIISAIIDKISAASSSDERQPFTLFALEKIMEAQLSRMRSNSNQLEKDTEHALAQIRKNFSEVYLENLLANKKGISKITSRITEIREAVEEVLEDPEDIQEIANLVHSESADKDDIIDEITSIFENFIEQVEDIDGHMNRLRENVDDTEEFLTLKLNARRTAIIRADLLATITTLILSFLAVVVGLYGTNIRNGLESNPEAFDNLRIGLVIFFAISLAVFYAFLKKKRLF